MDADERGRYAVYMRSGIRELHRMWNEGEPEVLDNPGPVGLLGYAIVGGIAYVAFKSGLLGSLGADLGKLTTGVSTAAAAASTGTTTAPSSTANSSAATSCYRKSTDGSTKTAAQIHAELTGPGGPNYPGPYDTASEVAAYMRACSCVLTATSC